MKEVWVLGGDERCRWAARTLEKGGLRVHCHAVPGCPSEALPERLADVVLPFPAFDGERLRGSTALTKAELCSRLTEDCRVFGGLLGDFPGGIELYGSEPLTTVNAAITAEGALQLAMERCSLALFDCRCLVLGFGRIGRQLTLRLRALGASVCVGARRPADRAFASSLGCSVTALPTAPESYDLVFNTVPAAVLLPGAFPESAVLIELASAPGALPKERSIPASGLPGKYAPASAGRAYAQAILHHFKKEELT